MLRHVIRWLAVMGLMTAAARPAAAQAECTVTSTMLGRWNDVDLTCGAATTSRAARVTSIALRGCPLLAGDTVEVTYENDDPARRPLVTGSGGRGWCSRSLPPGPYLGPCFIEEEPPVAELADTVGASSYRRSVVTWVRDTTDDRQSMAGRRCSPVELGPGVYRIYIEEHIKRSMWKPGPTYFADRRTMEDVSWETNRYEGGIYVDGALQHADTVTDVSSYVRGWTRVTQVRTPATRVFQPITLRTDSVVAIGVRFQPVAMRTDSIVAVGYRFTPVAIRTDSLAAIGYRFQPITTRTDSLVVVAYRFQPVTVRTDSIVAEVGRR